MGTAWYPSSNRSVCRSPATGWYHQLGLFLPCYCSKSAGNDRFRLVAAHCQAISAEGEGRRGRTWTLDAALPRRSRFVAHGEKKPRRGFMWRISFGDHGEKQRGREALKKKCELREACELLADASRGAQLEGEAGRRRRLVFLHYDKAVPRSPAGRRGVASSSFVGMRRCLVFCWKARRHLVFQRWDEALPCSS
ncbi:hypothetical protein GW17_00006239 [Ensete ventricosum]|nr:hypothetical protein GW17_00006239 [Ensete ventricosum]